jgi:hypothetical protein
VLRSRAPSSVKEKVLDLLMIAIVVAFFLVTWGIVVFFDRL